METLMTIPKKRLLIIAALSLCAMYCVIGDSLKRYYRPVGLKSSVSEYREGIRAAETMEAKAAESLEALRDWILKTGAETPLIHSKWYVDLWGEKYPEWTRQKRAEREFGRALLAEDEHRVQMANMHRAWMIEHNVGSPAKTPDPGNPSEIPPRDGTRHRD